MADADVQITAGTGTKVDTRTVGAGTDEHRQVVVIGDPTTAANVAIVDASGRILSVVEGNVANDAVDSGNPVKIGGVASSAALPAVAAGDRVNAWFDLEGRLVVSARVADQSGLGGLLTIFTDGADGVSNANDPLLTAALGSVYNGTSWDRTRSIGGLPAADANTGIQAVATVPHKVGYALASATAQYTTTQTSTILGPTNSTSFRPVVTSVQIQAGGTVSGAVQVYFGAGAYSRGTSLAVFDGEFAPSNTSKPGYAQSPPVPYMGVAGDEVRVTTSAAINPLTVTIWYYLVAV